MLANFSPNFEFGPSGGGSSNPNNALVADNALTPPLTKQEWADMWEAVSNAMPWNTSISMDYSLETDLSSGVMNAEDDIKIAPNATTAADSHFGFAFILPKVISADLGAFFVSPWTQSAGFDGSAITVYCPSLTSMTEWVVGPDTGSEPAGIYYFPLLSSAINSTINAGTGANPFFVVDDNFFPSLADIFGSTLNFDCCSNMDPDQLFIQLASTLVGGASSTISIDNSTLATAASLSARNYLVSLGCTLVYA